jgi:DNA-binding IclR family transcriptional regulator
MAILKLPMADSPMSVSRPRPSPPAERADAIAFQEDVPAPATIVKPVDNAIRILRHLALTGGKPSTVTLIARELKINPSTCFNILRTLAWNGMLEFDRNTKSYTLGLGAVDLANRALLKSGGDYINVMQPAMERAAAEYGVTITIWRRIGEDRLMLVHVVEGGAAVRLHVRLSQRLPLLIGASGRVMAAFGGVDAAEIRQRFPLLKWARPIAVEDYLAQVDKAREKGWAADEGNHVAGTTSFAAPIFNVTGTIRAALVATMLTGQHDKKTALKVAAEVVRLADAFTRGDPERTSR